MSIVSGEQLHHRRVRLRCRVRPAVPPVMPAPDVTNHRGLALMQALVDRVDVLSGEHGTTVVLAQSLTVPAGHRNGVAASF